MIERQFISQRLKEFQIQEYITNTLRGVEHSHTKVQRTPLGEKIIIFSSRPGLIVGRKGSNIKALTKNLKKKFNLDNPQIEISEVPDLNTNAQIVAEKIASSLERFGSNRFKGIMHKAMDRVMQSGAMGVEIVLSGKIPSSRARTWRIFQGYLKKCGDTALNKVNTAYSTAHLKTGSIGISVKIMPKGTVLPDDIKLRSEEEALAAAQEAKEQREEKEKAQKKDKKPAKRKRAAKKPAKKAPKKEKKE